MLQKCLKSVELVSLCMFIYCWETAVDTFDSLLTETWGCVLQFHSYSITVTRVQKWGFRWRYSAKDKQTILNGRKKTDKFNGAPCRMNVKLKKALKMCKANWTINTFIVGFLYFHSRQIMYLVMFCGFLNNLNKCVY